MSRNVVLLEGDTGQKLMSTELLAGEARQLSPTAALLARVYQAFATAVVQNNGAPGPTTLNGPAIGVNGALAGLWLLTFEVEIQDTAANLIGLAIQIAWGNSFSTVVQTNLQSVNGTTRLRVTVPILVAAPTVGTATSITFINTGLAAGQVLTIAASADNYSVFEYVGAIFPGTWT